MVILDTNMLSYLERANSPEGQRLRGRLVPLPPEEKATTIVSYEEQCRGWLAYLRNARDQVKLIAGYRRLKQQLQNYCVILVLDYDAAAAAEFQLLRKMRLGIGTLDLRIAAITRSRNATLISSNLSDFRKVPGLNVEDWTI